MPKTDAAGGGHIESESLGRLESLLRKDRSERDHEAVNRILASSATSSEKVRRIMDIDRRATRALRARARRRYLGAPELANGELRVRAQRPPNVIRHQERQGFLAYLFRERPQIKGFGRTSGTLTTALFPPQIRLTPQVPGVILGYLRPTARDVTALITQLLGNAWMHLEKTDYNLLVLVMDLCEAIDRLPTNSEEYRGPRAHERLKGIQQRLLAIRYERDAVERINDSIEYLIARNRRAIEKLEALPRLVKQIISAGDHRPTLLEVVLAVNMARYRRFVTESDLLVPGLGSVVDANVFDCSDSVYERIQDHVRHIVHQLEELEREQRSILTIRAYVKRESGDQVDLAALQSLVASSTDTRWETIADNVVAIAHACVPPLAELLTALFHRPLTLRGIGRVTLFAGNTFQDELSRVSRAAERLRKVRSSLPALSVERFLNLVDRRESATTAEADFLMQIGIVQDSLKTIRDRLQAVLAIDFTIAAPETVAKHLPLNGRETLPFEAEITSGHTFVTGSNLRAAFARVVELLYVTSYVLGDRTLRHRLSREHQVVDDMEHLLDTVDRIAEPAQAEEIIARFAR